MVAVSGIRKTNEVTLGMQLGRRAAPLALSMAGPALLSLAFPPFNLGFVALVALVPLMLLWSRQTWKQAFWWGWFAGIMMFAAILYWTSATVFEFVGAWASLALLLLCAIEGFAVGATAVVAALAARGAFRPWSILALPAGWLLFESVRTRGSLGVPFGGLGLAAAHIPWLLPLAAYGGVYLLSAVLALANAAVTAIVAGPKQMRIAGTAVLFVLAALVIAADVRPLEPIPATLRVGIIQGNIEQDVKWDPNIFAQTQRVYAALTRQAAARGAKVVVWPETAITESAPQDHALLGTLTTLTTTSHVWLLSGTLDNPSPQSNYNALLDVAPSGSVAGVYHKHWLVPFAEYLPFANILGRIPIMNQASGFDAGPGPHLLGAGGYRFGPLICYESAFAPYARATVNAGADVLLIATDDAWFSNTPEPYQHADIAAVEAVATGRWVVRAASTGISEIIDPRGRIVSRLGVGQRGVIIGSVGKGVTTPYDRHGIAWLLIASLFIVIGAFTLGATTRQTSAR